MHHQLYADHQLLVFVQRIASTEPQKRLRPQPVWVSWNAAVRQWWEVDMCQTILPWAIRSPITRPDQAHVGTGRRWRFGRYRRRDLALFHTIRSEVKCSAVQSSPVPSSTACAHQPLSASRRAVGSFLQLSTAVGVDHDRSSSTCSTVPSSVLPLRRVPDHGFDTLCIAGPPPNQVGRTGRVAVAVYLAGEARCGFMAVGKREALRWPRAPQLLQQRRKSGDGPQYATPVR